MKPSRSIVRRSRPGCSKRCEIGPDIRSRPWASTWIWKPTWESIPSSESRSSARCATEFPALKDLSDSAEVMDALARARTLGVIVDRMTALAEKAKGPSAATKPGFSERGRPMPAASSNGKPQELTQRRLLQTVEAPLPIDRLGLMPGGRVVITDDGAGVAAELASLLQAADTDRTSPGRSR